MMPRLALTALLAVVMAGAAPAPAGNPEVPEQYISVDQAKALLDKNERVTFIDVREKSQYDDLHIKGAINIPLGVLPARLSEVPRMNRVVLY
jgi:3-mercaptopyruvate sulfurtransferase SseA